MGEQQQRAVRIAKGLTLHSMTLEVSSTGRLVWEHSNFDTELFSGSAGGETRLEIPAAVLRLTGVTCKLTFGSEEAIQALRVVHRFFLHGACMEEWHFTFGFVIPGSTNPWVSTIHASPQGLLSAELLSGLLRVESSFFDGDSFIAKLDHVIYYVD